ncbi:hypothetical protein FCULG_00012139 [Fusarium culmorum]|uniref:Uncharacterized protein n=1 Tax=Fusarium culmorum TaxID=5516 RepID=A0A2T4GF42_FUSCU|nr:hypothetical protein FCULG_00012139 [Fusarium culmorum]
MSKTVIINTTADILENGEISKRLKKLSSKAEGLWARIYDITGLEVLGATSCCYNIARADIYNVTMTGDAIAKEPHWVPNFNYKKTTVDRDWQGLLKKQTRDILSQFGISVETKDTAQRGILKLDIGPRTDKDRYFGPPVDGHLTAVLHETTIESNTTWNLSGDDNFDAGWSAHEIYSAIFLSTVLTTGDPALAIQSVAYYELLSYYDLEYPVTTMNLTKKLIPMQWLGLGLVIGIAVVHLIQVSVVIIIFLSRTRLSALGNAWQAVAQATHVTKAVESSEIELDKEIDAWAEANGHAKDIYVLSPSTQAGKVELRQRQRKG